MPVRNYPRHCLSFGILPEATSYGGAIPWRQLAADTLGIGLIQEGASACLRKSDMKVDDDVAGSTSRLLDSATPPLQVVIEDLRSLPRLHAMEDLQVVVWGRENRTVVPAHLLALVVHTGGIVLGAFQEEEPVGFVFGLLARDGDRLYHASHMLGIHPRAQGTGIGAALKWRQRERALEQGLDVMTWTFDPLEARNAHFNLHKLGVVSRVYRTEFYGEMEDDLNRGLPSDRLSVEWRLREPTSRSDHVYAFRDAIKLVWDAGGRPIVRIPVEAHTGSSGSGAPLLIEAPRDVQLLKRENMEIAQAWRFAQREAFTWAFEHGYSASDFRDGAFVLLPEDGSGVCASIG